METLASVAVQVPAVAIFAFAFVKIASLFFSRWGAVEGEKIKVLEKAETERTATIAKGFADIVSELQNHGAALATIQDAVMPFSVKQRR